MIESRYWKKDLLEFAAALNNQKEINRWSEKAQVLFEKQVILNFFIIRKLIEVNKVSDTLSRKEYKIKAFKKNTAKLTTINHWDFNELYDSNAGETKSKNITFISNQLIHSLTLFAFIKDKKWDSVLMCSDYEKNKFVYEIDVKTIIEILTDFGNNYPENISYTYNEGKDDYDLKIE